MAVAGFSVTKVFNRSLTKSVTEAGPCENSYSPGATKLNLELSAGRYAPFFAFLMVIVNVPSRFEPSGQAYIIIQSG